MFQFKKLFFLLLILLTISIAACGGGSSDDDDNDQADDDDAADDDVADDDATDDDAADDDAADDDVADDDAADDDATDDDDDNTPPPGCDTLTEGLNSGFMVDGVARSFYLDLPEGVEEQWPWPVVFSFHGFGDSGANFRGLMGPLVDFEGFPFIAVTPDDTNMIFDFDIINGNDPNNREVRLFDEVLAEIDKCWGVDYDHVHTTGFSFGGATALMINLNRSETIASVATCSGVYGSNPENVIPYTVADWPGLETVDYQFVELRLHGGILDNMILPFGAYGTNDVAYLTEKGHDAIECIHPYIHNMGFMYMGPETFVEFFRDHPKGTTVSPYKDGLPGDYGRTCVYLPAQ